MFAIIITEKGGTERREVFDKTEINVGRVQGNELMLPKGNVSKHHARLLYRDGRFIVTDLKSTNGTYVNGRKITQATIVREGDRIYVGDFVIRLEVPPQNSSPEIAIPTPAEPPPAVPSSQNPPFSGPGAAVSHYPLENDPDDPSWSGDPPAQVRVPAPPRLPTNAARPTAVAPFSPPRPTVPPTAVQHAPEVAPPRPPVASVASARPATPARVAAPPVVRTLEPPSISPIRNSAVALIRHVEEALDAAVLQGGSDAAASSIDRALRDKANQLRNSGSLPANTDIETVITEARTELIGLGPLEPLLHDDDVAEIRIPAYSSIITERVSGMRRAEAPFASEASMMRILRRMCAQCGAPIVDEEHVVERYMQTPGGHLIAVLPPVSQQGASAVVRKQSIAPQTLEDLVRNNAMSRAMATLLTQAVGSKLNILVACASGSDSRAFMSALSSAARPSDQIVVLQEPRSAISVGRDATTLVVQDARQGSEVARVATRLGMDMLVVTAFEHDVAAEVIDAIGAGLEGVIAAAHAPSLRHALARVAPEVANSRPGLPVEAVREAIHASFDLLVEYVHMRDGRARVLRIAEPAGVEGKMIALRDIFTFAVERTASGGAIEGSFHPTGIVPKAAEDLQARGMPLDPSLFRR